MPDSSNNVNTRDGASIVDWSRPIETNEGIAVTAEEPGGNGNRLIRWRDKAGDHRIHYFCPDGRSNVIADQLWVRNVQPTTPERDPALWDRMEALVRRMALCDATEFGVMGTGCREAYVEASEIALALPKPVDPDLIEARKLANEFAAGKSQWTGILDGKHDESPAVRHLLAAIKRGRELAAPEVSHVG